jgi:hypothetical protein
MSPVCITCKQWPSPDDPNLLQSQTSPHTSISQLDHVLWTNSMAGSNYTPKPECFFSRLIGQTVTKSDPPNPPFWTNLFARFFIICTYYLASFSYCGMLHFCPLPQCPAFPHCGHRTKSQVSSAFIGPSSSALKPWHQANGQWCYIVAGSSSFDAPADEPPVTIEHHCWLA